MQPVNVSPTFVSQDADLKTKDSSSAIEGDNKESDFSSLVEQHLPDENKANSRNNSTAAEQAATANNGKAIAASGKSDVDEANNRQESDSVESHDVNKISQEDKDNSSVDETDKESSTDSAALTESEQFISLLYNSDQTLAKNESAGKEGEQAARVKSSQISKTNGAGVVDGNAQGNNGKVAAVDGDVTAEQDNYALASEHKLKAFSKDELLARAQLKNSHAVASQSSDQALKAYQQSLQDKQELMKTESITSQQLINAQLANGQLNNKLTDVAAAVSQASINQLSEDVDSGLYQLPVEPIVKGKPTATDLSPSSQAAVVRGAASQNEQQVTLAKKAKDDASSKLAADLLVEPVDPATELSKGTQGEQNSKANLSVNNNAVVNSQSNKTISIKASSDETSPANSSSDNANAQMISSTIAAAELDKNESAKVSQNQQKMTQTLVNIPVQGQATSSEPQSVDALDEEYAFVDSMGLSEENNKEKLVKPEINVGLTRSAAELNLQAGQANQALQSKQTNDAYLEHQVSEMINHTVATDTAQIQKNNVQLHQETISILRKDFADAVKDKVMIMINQKLQQFDITLDPPEFGNMQVRVNLQGEQASVNFIVQNQQAKDALEQNMDKLRDMLAEQGVDVGDANVEQQSQQQGENSDDLQKNNGTSSRLTATDGQGADNVEHILSAQLFDASATGVDYYA